MERGWTTPSTGGGNSLWGLRKGDLTSIKTGEVKKPKRPSPRRPSDIALTPRDELSFLRKGHVLPGRGADEPRLLQQGTGGGGQAPMSCIEWYHGLHHLGKWCWKNDQKVGDPECHSQEYVFILQTKGEPPRAFSGRSNRIRVEKFLPSSQQDPSTWFWNESYEFLKGIPDSYDFITAY